MLSWLKKHFIPHDGNDHRPHILREVGTRNIIVFVIFLEIFAFLLPTLTNLSTTGGMAAVLPAVLADLTNQERQGQGLAPLTVSPLLNKAAEMKAADMATYSYFAHTSPAGKTPWYWLTQVGYNYQYAGENLAINFTDSQDVTNAWMASPEHRANIVKGNYTEIGTGTATGVYEGHNTIYVVQLYANPIPAVAESPAIKPTPIAITAQKPKVVPIRVATESTNVLGAQTTTLPQGAMNAPVANDITSVTPPVPIAQNTPQPTFWQRLLASPRNTTDIAFSIIFGIIALALVLYVVVRAYDHHLDLITNGLVVIAVIGVILVANNYMSHKTMMITQSLNYSNPAM